MSYGQVKYNKDKKPYIVLEFRRLHPVTKEKFYRSKKVMLDENLTPAKLKKSANEIDAEFIEECEREIKLGLDTTAITYKEFAEKYLDYLKENMSPNTYNRNFQVSEFAIKELGKYKLRDLVPQVIDDFIHKINNLKSTREKTFPKEDFNKILEKRNLNYHILRYDLGIQHDSLRKAIDGKSVTERWAKNLANKINIPFDKLFYVVKEEYELAYNTKKKYLSFLKESLSYAVKKRYIENNYATSKYVDSIKNKEPNRKTNVMSSEDYERFYNFVSDYPDLRKKNAIFLILNTGMRKEELLGLTWENIQFDKEAISIENTVIYTAKTGIVFSNKTKNSSSCRTIAVSKDVIKSLKEYKEYCDKKVVKSIYLFSQEDGNLIFPSTINYWLDTMLNEAGLKHYTVHSLRHVYASYIIENTDESLIAVSKRIGHSRVSTTTDIYSHVISNKDRKIANVMTTSENETDELGLLKEKIKKAINCILNLQCLGAISEEDSEKIIQILKC